MEVTACCSNPQKQAVVAGWREAPRTTPRGAGVWVQPSGEAAGWGPRNHLVEVAAADLEGRTRLLVGEAEERRLQGEREVTGSCRCPETSSLPSEMTARRRCWWARVQGLGAQVPSHQEEVEVGLDASVATTRLPTPS